MQLHGWTGECMQAVDMDGILTRVSETKFPGPSALRRRHLAEPEEMLEMLRPGVWMALYCGTLEYPTN